ncbi:MAG: hypothetical protein JWM35_666 [Verrucomicrobia bacterium]|nr:hypothetical protein [Verrucomicrobiota bacterium]
MHSFRVPSVIFTSTALLVGAQTTAPASSPSLMPDEESLGLDTYVVTSGPDAEAAFDLAQRAAILAGHDLLLRETGTLGETLSATLGVNSTYNPP